MFDNKILVISGGTGSFGNAVVRRFLDSNVGEIRILSRDEKKQDDMRKRINSNKLKFYIGDVRDYQSILPAFHGANFLFHAAALKQVPSCEFYPLEAVKTNILGTENVLQAAVNCELERVVCLSTDKAVYPINAMGMSKAMMEKVIVAKARNYPNRPIICVTRYGNVMGSRGSVIPLFIDQVKSNRPITITDPSMTRFMMSLDDAVDLVVFAFTNGSSGDTYIQKAPASTISDLAEAIKIKTGKLGAEVQIIGTRHGEKVYEVLCSREEMLSAEDVGDYIRIPADNRDLNYEKYFEVGSEKLSQETEYNSHNTKRLSVDETVQLLNKINDADLASSD